MATGSSTTTITVQPASEKPERIETSLNYEANQVSPGNALCADYFDQIN
jgi:hypothetical protein